MSGDRPRLVAAAVLAAAFLAGAVLGGAGYGYLAGPAEEGGRRSPAATGGEGGAERGPGDRGGHGKAEDRDGGPTSAMLEILREEVGISDRQREEVRAILERREERAHRIFEDVRGRFRRWMDTTVARVQTVLDEEQAAEFERRFERRLEEWRRRRHGGVGPDAPGAGEDTTRAPERPGDTPPRSPADGGPGGGEGDGR